MRTHTQFAQATGTIETLVGRTRRLDTTDAVSVHLKPHAQLAALLQRIGASKRPLQEQIASGSGGGSSSRNRCRRQAMNTPIQGLAADIMKYVTARVEQLLQQQQAQAFISQQRRPHDVDSTLQHPSLWASHRAFERPLKAQVVLQIHDELLLEVHEEDVQLTLELVLPMMQRAWGLLLVETGCLDRYAALCNVQRRLSASPHLDDNDDENAKLQRWVVQSAGCSKDQQEWFDLPHHYEWLRPLLQRILPTSAKVGRDWACC